MDRLFERAIVKEYAPRARSFLRWSDEPVDARWFAEADAPALFYDRRDDSSKEEVYMKWAPRSHLVTLTHTRPLRLLNVSSKLLEYHFLDMLDGDASRAGPPPPREVTPPERQTSFRIDLNAPLKPVPTEPCPYMVAALKRFYGELDIDGYINLGYRTSCRSPFEADVFFGVHGMHGMQGMHGMHGLQGMQGDVCLFRPSACGLTASMF